MFIRKASSVNKEKCSVRHIDGGIKAIRNDKGACSETNRDDSGDTERLLDQQKRNINREREDENTKDDQNSGHTVRLLHQQKRNRDREDEETTDDQKSGHAVRLLDRQRRREKLQEIQEKKAAIVRWLFPFSSSFNLSMRHLS